MYNFLLKRTNKKSIASMLNKYVAIQEKVSVNDGMGNVTETWETMPSQSSVPAAIWPLTAVQKAEFRSHNVIATDWLLLRGEIIITEYNHQVLYAPRIFEVLTVENIQEQDILNLCVVKERRA